ncbi:hypothetical protein LW138_07030 [Helicobacter sp. faydin-H17]|nr:hypothetical protein [Helicobacter kayseriensis]
MNFFLNRIGKAFQSFFSEIFKTILFRPLTPTGRLVFYIHICLLYAIVWIGYSVIFLLSMHAKLNTPFFVTLFFLLAFLYCSFIIRAALNRIADLRLSFNDERTLFFTTKSILFILAGSITLLISIALVTASPSKAFHPFYPPLFPSENTYPTPIPNSYLLPLFFAPVAVLISLILTSLMFPAKTFNIFENFTFSHKLKDFVFFCITGVLFFLFLFLFQNQEKQDILLIAISCLTLILIALGQNFYSRFLLISFLVFIITAFYTLSPFTTPFNFNYAFSPFIALLCAIFLLTCRKNFFLCLIPVLALRCQDHHLTIWSFLFCIYLALIVDYFDFKNKKDILYSSLWAMCIAGFFVFLLPLFKIPSPSWFALLSKFALFVLLSGLFMGIIYLNCKLKNNPQYKLLSIMGIGALLYLSFPLFLKDINAFGLNFTHFQYIVYALILWIVSNDEKISSAYKLAICALICCILFPPPTILVEQNMEDSFIWLNCILLYSALILYYFFYRTKSPFRYILLAMLPSSIFSIFVPIDIVHLYLEEVKPSLITTLSWISFACHLLSFAVCCYIFYKLKDSFNANLTLKT